MEVEINITADNGKKYHGIIELTEVKGKKSRTIIQTETSSNNIPNNILEKIVDNITKIKTSELVLIVLRFNQKLTRKQQIKFIKKIGKKTESLSGGNYNRGLLEKGLVTEVGTLGKETVYNLTEKGKRNANTIIKDLK